MLLDCVSYSWSQEFFDIVVGRYSSTFVHGFFENSRRFRRLAVITNDQLALPYPEQVLGETDAAWHIGWS